MFSPREAFFRVQLCVCVGVCGLYPSATPIHLTPPLPPPILSSFTPATLMEIINFLSQSSTSSCDIDPIPTTVLEYISDAISLTIQSIVNLALLTGTFPPPLKSSFVSLLLKKPSLNKDDLSNYSPIVNLFFISKLIEKTSKNCLVAHLSST